MKEGTKIEELLNKMATYCVAAERCKQDVEKKLEKWDLTEEEIQSILNALIKDNFINESRYAAAYTNDKYKFSKWGRRKIAQNLYMKRIDNDLIQEALEQIDNDIYQSNLKSILETKRRSIKASNAFEFNQKLARFAIGRGFDYSEVIQILPSLEDYY